jgi:cobyrinic acid a,c-diamide synthase
MGALCRRKLKVQPFKTGPDYIDPSYHTWVTGQPSRNLDTWMLSHAAVIESFSRAMAGKDIGVIEGVMGLYDGRYSTSDEGSTAELAKLLRVPVILVVDSRKGARSLAAMVKGYQTFDRGLNLCGVILNGIGSDKHLEICREAIEHYTGVKVIGHLPRRQELSLPERHLGLVPAVENPESQEFLDKLSVQSESTLNISEILRLALMVKIPECKPVVFPQEVVPAVCRIAVARDKAFSFYYQDNLDLLQAWGAEIVAFSPLQETQLPPNISGIYLGGGFPEMYAGELENNLSLRQEIKRCSDQGMPVYAECGGLMYLGDSLRDLNGREYQMAGAIPVSSCIDKPRLSLGYRTVEALDDGPLLQKGQTVRGHEFHWSVLKHSQGCENAYRVLDDEGRMEGFQIKNLLSSYIHLHFASLPSLAPHFVKVCQEFRTVQR